MSFTNFIIFLLVIAFIIIVLAQIAKLGDLITYLKKDPEKAEEESANNIGLLFAFVGFAFLILLTWSFFHWRDKWLPEAANELGRDWDNIFGIFSIPIIIVFFLTHFALFVFIYRYRYKKGRIGTYFPESHKLEMIWTAIPAVVMIALVALGIPKWNQFTKKPSDDAMHIRVTGMQFKWMINYPGADGEFGDRNIRKNGNLSNLLGLDPEDSKGMDDLFPDEIVIPVDKEIYFQIGALDVLHDFYLPHFRAKMDAVPGVPTGFGITADVTTAEMREKLDDPNFEFEVACAELCGTGHWNMKKVLRVVEQDEYDAWVAEQTLGKDGMYKNIKPNEEKEVAIATAHE